MLHMLSGNILLTSFAKGTFCSQKDVPSSQKCFKTSFKTTGSIDLFT